ncbi:hypothetical protein Tmar_1386 [Thermaerobacter marianensis DSM 12885]|uniref:DUF3243 domain-containing protein n=1 Tax=Thermaerobacter marianensis (strain ATCC 700841 / DSM 12885 / JCM 10246 / 7p75a) TaxID=644966 RepID=E6SMK7_THEM7|nr:DUF3243 domain-containing protein [Thermaerobacter marianensis]ADU51499.1 hypothetical protein Tmar_1386 [Thermaerobacter marianensis DSM 12885]
MPVTDQFQQFTQELAQRIQAARQAGMSQQDIKARAQQIGDWLAQEVAPRTPEQRLLKEMWQVANPHEQEAIASSLVKLLQRQPTVSG